jgi:heme/copper-type cytochrome/quinol oxidase subunit 3
VLGGVFALNRAVVYAMQAVRESSARAPASAVALELVWLLGVGVAGGALYTVISGVLARRGARSRGRAGALAGVLLGLAFAGMYAYRARGPADMTPLGFLLLAPIFGGGIGAFCATALPERPRLRRSRPAG